MVKPEEILAFWLDELSPGDWYKAEDALDQMIRDRFEATWNAAMDGALSLWLTYPSGTLAYIILTDQFPRNMFRGSAKAFASDAVSRAAAKMAIDRGWDLKIDEPARQFFYVPLMHSECLVDQERSVRLIMTRMPETGADNLVHARAHREIIRRFGRFPYRNEALARTMTPAELSFVSEEGGYGAVVNALRPAA